MSSRRACSVLTYTSRPARGGDGTSARDTSLLWTTSRIYSRNPPKRRLLASNHTPKMRKSFKHMSASRRWGCPSSQHHPACFGGHLQRTGLLAHHAQQKTLVQSLFSRDGPSVVQKALWRVCICCCCGAGLSKDGGVSPNRD